MKTKKMKPPAFAGLAIGLAVVLAGCASAGYRRSEQTAFSLQSSANRIERAGLQVQLAVATLNDLINNPQPDLRPQFEKFSAAVGKADSLVTSIREADETLQARSTVYFDNWDQELAAIQNDDIRASGQARKLEVLSRCNNVRNNCLTAQTQASPLLSDLNDIQRFLSSDLTPGGLTAIRDATVRVNQLSAPVQEYVNKLVADMRALGTAMSPEMVAEK
jgi:hypothetical protein